MVEVDGFDWDQTYVGNPEQIVADAQRIKELQGLSNGRMFGDVTVETGDRRQDIRNLVNYAVNGIPQENSTSLSLGLRVVSRNVQSNACTRVYILGGQIVHFGEILMVDKPWVEQRDSTGRITPVVEDDVALQYMTIEMGFIRSILEARKKAAEVEVA